MYVYCVYPAMSKSPKQVQNCLKIAVTSVVIIISMVSSFKSAIIPFTVALHDSGTTQSVLGP